MQQQPLQRRVPRWRPPAPGAATRTTGMGAGTGVEALTQAMGRMAFAPPPLPLPRRARRVVPLGQAKSQTAMLVAAVQQPRAADDGVALLLGPEANDAYCPVESIETAHGKAIAAGTEANGTVYGRLLGAGTNARVYALVWPAAAPDVPGFAGLDAPLAIKIPTSAIAAPGVAAQADAFMAALPCWDRRRGDYACPIEVEAEALLSALASGLFVDGITPGTVAQMRAFVCPGRASERALCLIQERLGVDTGAGAMSPLSSGCRCFSTSSRADRRAGSPGACDASNRPPSRSACRCYTRSPSCRRHLDSTCSTCVRPISCSRP
ncbi:hypothetical protein TW95_gp1426 [Pandoravirus inopinatum]|uniref:Uncharacterized protein n=1 Tax=Pandoravirus inopinatum TaxID=1605721 RepID=A0A0B5J8E4_9VIRU|nr:hypothetical protein TW95_gp1426 [Pandoravirus inopinatum]AJF98160.1 hypothetical protein [Pandoravirus inopinatum]